MSKFFSPQKVRASRSIGITTLPNQGLIHPAVALRDCGFLSLVLLLSLILYIRGLGFYADDWAFLSAFSHSSADSLSELFRALYAYENVRPRPL